MNINDYWFQILRKDKHTFFTNDQLYSDKVDIRVKNTNNINYCTLYK